MRRPTKRPTANAGPNQTVKQGAAITLDGSGSSDPDGHELTYIWEQKSGTDPDGNEHDVFAGNTTFGFNVSNPTFTPQSGLPVGTVFVFRLTVQEPLVSGGTPQEPDGLSSKDLVTITITRNQPPAADAGLDQAVEVGAAFTLDGSGSSDPDDHELTYTWRQSGGPDVLDSEVLTSAEASPTITPTNPDLVASDALVFELTVTDSNGNTSMATVTITLIAALSAGAFTDLNNTVLPEVARAFTDQTVGAITERIGQARDGTTRSVAIAGQSTLAGAASVHGQAIADGTLSLKDVLGNSDFVLPLDNVDDGMDDGILSSLTLWGGGGYRNFEGSSGDVSFDGDLFSAHLGLDARPRDDLLIGLAASWGQSDLDYRGGGSDLSGDHKLNITGVHPYASWEALAGQLDLWVTAGYGWGDLEITNDGMDRVSSDVETRTVGGGGDYQLPQIGATKFKLKSSALLTELEVEGSDDIEALDVESSLLRMVLEGSHKLMLSDGAYMEPSLEAGVRYDGGDGETGFGAELGAGFRYTDPIAGLTLEGRARTLVGRDNYEEWGVSGLILLEQGRNGRGLSFSLSPGYGITDSSSTQELWREGLRNEISDDPDYGARLDTRLGYGLTAPGGQGLLTPYSEMTFGDSSRSYRLGMRWELDSLFDLNLTGERSESDSNATDHAIMLKGDIQF